MCTRGWSITFGLAGVLSTVTMGLPYDREIAAQLIRLRKHGWNWLFFSRVNLKLSQPLKSESGFDRLLFQGRARNPPSVGFIAL